ncbi:hypothetical protein ALI144C_15980 [Actinosynnema sp. ALI-1.44]|uniref:NB-ARC domain-containing protein n=1 Tax=Actinosynnema sp. ALI-1.44 TaxID=1933779 RepID=UPI00097BB0CD|nr:NB-ARC domain-containing protein [Actinosynnema sp. ALI-1.44]ONI84174.1 hypothetical protein ALI144C_15980 [Actinosynnema sp. ALI-1.44]
MTTFSHELDLVLTSRGLSWRRLAKLTGYTPGWLIKIKNGAPPSAELARRCDEVLEAGGTLIALTHAQPVRPAQLPAATASFVGRADELLKLDEALRDDGSEALRVVTIEGPPGTGKTALALRLANDVAARFPDGHLYIDLNGFSGDGVPVAPAQALEEFLGALEVPPDEIPARPEGKAALFRSVLAHRRVLVVLDNAVDSRQVQHLLPGGTGCAVVVTSRNRLSGLAVRTHATRVALGPLSSVDSVRLLTTMITGDRADDADALAELSRRCAHVPLALRIAAEHVNNRPGASLRDLAEDLAVVDDDSAVWTVFSWSYRGLDAATARMFRLVSLHPGTLVCVSAAAALTGETHQRAQALLKSLAGMHLVDQAGRDWYRLHDLLRLYGRECSRAEDSAEDRHTAVRRLTEWYLHSAVAANEALAPFRVHVLELPPSAVTTMTFDGPVAATARRALRMCEEIDDLYGQGRKLVTVADVHVALAEYDEALDCVDRSLVVRREVGDRWGEADSLTRRGDILRDAGDTRLGEKAWLAALALYEELADPRAADIRSRLML